MSKKVATQPLSDNTRKLIIIIAIVLVAVIILSVALALILKTEEKTPAVDNTDNSNSSTLPIKNGDFLYSKSDETGYPHSAVNWTKYGYKAPSGSSHDFENITSNDKSVMGIIDVSDDNWSEVTSDLKDEDITLAKNPKLHKDIEAEDSNIYMIFNREATSASILSDSASVSSGTSIKITVWLNVAQVENGNAVIMIQKSSISAKKDNWYAYDFAVVGKTGTDIDENGWQKHEFYIFNREASTQYFRVSVGLGNAYQEGGDAKGVLFVDDIGYETVTANDYREQVDKDVTYDEDVFKPFKILENEDITDKSEYFELVGDNSTTTISGPYTDFASFKQAVGDGKAYLPFTNRDDFLRDGKATGFTIYQVTQNGTDVTALRLATNDDGIDLTSSPVDKDHYHISFWLRVDKKDNHAATEANVYVQKAVDGDEKWEDIQGGSFTKITTSQDVDTDTNCGWVKYDIYLKPSTAQSETISILFVLGSKDGYTQTQIDEGEVPQGSLFVTSPAYEKISYKDYNNASNGNNVRKLNLIGATATPSISNGSFSDVNNVGNEPTSWTPVFAGDNAIYKDGKGNQLNEEKRQAALVQGSGVVKKGSNLDDGQNSVLQISAKGTNFGYISNDITLSSRTVYVFSVLVESGKTPYIYLIDNSKERGKAVVARLEKSHNAETEKTLDGYFLDGYADDGFADTDWVRYYLVFVTGNESASVRLALFNGKIDAVDGQNVATGTILYDEVKMKSIGTYSFVEDEDNKDATHYLVKFNAGSDAYQDAIDALTTEDHDAINTESELVAKLGGIVEPSKEEWEEMTLIPEDNDGDNSGEGDDTTTTTPSEVDWGLLMSVISSVLLVAALLIVLVIKLFQRKRSRIA